MNNVNAPLKKSDTIGVLSSGLCMIHCLATPFFFVATACSATCCSGAPLWWQWLDYFFLIISFIAVRHSTVSTNSKIDLCSLISTFLYLLFIYLFKIRKTSMYIFYFCISKF